MALTPTTKTIFLVGTSGWTYDHWKGCYYPADLPKSHWFDYYARHFQTVEVNATFYRTFRDDTYKKWKDRPPQGFKYVLKAPRLITHRKFLVDVDADIASFYHSCCLLEDKFGMILLQVAPNMPVDLERLRKALHAFPDPHKVSVEFRRPGWLETGALQLLSELGISICNPDSPRQMLSSHLTSKIAYLRLHGRHHWYMYKYSEDDLREIAALARELAERGAEVVYVFFNNDYEGAAPENALILQALLREV